MMKYLIASMLSLSCLSYAQGDIQDPVLGSWENVTNGDVVGLTIKADGECEIYIERSYQNRAIKDCKFEPFRDQYVIFLVKADGTCGDNPDFEFSFEPEAPLVRLYIQGSPMLLNRVKG